MDRQIAEIMDLSSKVPDENCCDFYKQLLNSLYDGISLFEFCGNKVKAIYLNQRYFENVGYTPEQYLPYFDNITVTLFEEDEQRIFDTAKRCVEENTDFNCDVRGYRYDGTVGWFNVRARIVDFIKRDGIVFLASINDVTTEKQLQHRLSINEERYRILEETTSTFLYIYNCADDVMTFSSHSGAQEVVISNYSGHLRKSDQIHPEDVNYYFNAISKACRKQCKSYIDIRSLNKECTEYVPCRNYISSIPDEYGDIISVMGRIELLEDAGVTAELMCNNEYEIFDFMCSPHEGIDLINNKISKGNAKGFLAVIDIDDFSGFNKKYGPETSDNAVKLAAELICCIFEDAVIFRYTGDQFVVYMENITESELYEMEEKLRLAGEMINLSDNSSCTDSLSMTFSTGAAWTVNSEKTTFKDYFITADKALFRAKKAGKNRMYVEKIIY